MTVDGAVRKPSYRLKGGEAIAAEIEPPAAPAGPQPEDIPLAVLHADADIIVLDKPSGLVVHPGAGARSGTLVNALLARFPGLADLARDDRPGIVHRLDKETSGVMVVARSARAEAELKRQFKDRVVKKAYLALAWGRMRAPAGTFSWAIGRHPRHGERMSIRTDHPRSALTEYTVVRAYREFSLLEVRPLTGRTHQIRVHLAAAGHPIAGDGRYGQGRNARRRFPRLFLHAARLSFLHPATGERVEFAAPLPAELQVLLDSLEA